MGISLLTFDLWVVLRLYLGWATGAALSFLSFQILIPFNLSKSIS